MADFGIYAADTSKTVYFRLRDSTTGLAKTGLLFNSAGASASYTLPGAASVVITLTSLGSAAASWSSGGFILVSDTNAKGLYRLDLPNAAIASGDFVVISLEFDNTIEESMLIPLHSDAAKALATDTYIEPPQGAPGVNISISDKIGFLYKAFRNKKEQTVSEFRVFNDDAVTVDHKCTVSDDGVTATKNEIATGP